MKCHIANKCGGCDYINQGYQASLEYKNQYIKELFQEFKVKIHPIQHMDDPYGYRNKVIVAFNKDYSYGLYQEGTHKIIPYEHCLLHNEIEDGMIKKIAQLFKRYHVPIYDIRRHTGEIRHVVLRYAKNTEQYMITIVSSSERFKGSKNFAKELTKAYPQIKTIILNTNKRDTVVVLGNREQVLYGKGFIVDELCGLTFKISSKSFYQINHDQCEALYAKGLSLMHLQKDDVVLDTYCGIGTIGMIAAKDVERVIGVEKNKDAILDANINKKANNLQNITFINADATEYMKEASLEKMYVDKIIMDPPRTGSTKAFIQAACKMQPIEILYISCGPETQVRDLKLFKKYGYTFKEVFSFDMFPFTKHVETVVLLSKGMVDNRKVKVDFSLEDMDLSEFKGKATYEQIKVYVLEQTGLKVSNLYIAQIKKKCGLDGGESFNLPKSENAKQPKCTPEKEEAIMQAFKHFGII